MVAWEEKKTGESILWKHRSKYDVCYCCSLSARDRSIYCHQWHFRSRFMAHSRHSNMHWSMFKTFNWPTFEVSPRKGQYYLFLPSASSAWACARNRYRISRRAPIFVINKKCCIKCLSIYYLMCNKYEYSLSKSSYMQDMTLSLHTVIDVSELYTADVSSRSLWTPDGLVWP